MVIKKKTKAKDKPKPKLVKKKKLESVDDMAERIAQSVIEQIEKETRDAEMSSSQAAEVCANVVIQLRDRQEAFEAEADEDYDDDDDTDAEEEEDDREEE